MGRLLCKLGMHRWEFKDDPVQTINGEKRLISWCRCAVHGCGENYWRVVNIDTRRKW